MAPCRRGEGGFWPPAVVPRHRMHHVPSPAIIPRSVSKIQQILTRILHFLPARPTDGKKLRLRKRYALEIAFAAFHSGLKLPILTNATARLRCLVRGNGLKAS